MSFLCYNQSQIIMQVTLHNFKQLRSYRRLLHNYLMSILTTNNYQQQHLPEKIMQYIGMIVQSEKNQDLNQDFFQFFCEHSGNKIIKLTLEVQPMLSIKVLSMLFINLSEHYWISYLLCQPFIIDAIQYEDVPADQQWPEHYISLLKSLSIRLNEQQLSLFYNKKFCRFPLLYEALKYYNHPDCMVRTNVMNIILGVMKIKDPRLSKYFGRFPFTSYVITYCCQVKSRIAKLNQQLLKLTKLSLQELKDCQKNHISITKSYYIDLIDYICYLNDLMEMGPFELGYMVENCIFVYIILPTLKYLSLNYPPILTCSTLLLLFTIFKNITNQRYKQILCTLIMGKQLPRSFTDIIENQNIQQVVYIPKVYSDQFQPNKYYWNKFDYQIQNQCVKIFDDVKDFQTDHESRQEDPAKAKQFQEEIYQISASLGFNILSYQKFKDKIPISQLLNALGLQNSSKGPIVQNELKQKVYNPVRRNILAQLSTFLTDPKQDSLIFCISTLINNLITCETISNKILQFCGLLFPKIDTVLFKQDYNIQQIRFITNLGLKFLGKANQRSNKFNLNQGNMQDEGIKVDNDTFSILTIKNLCILFYNSIYERLPSQEEKIIDQFYKCSLLELKNLVSKKNMKTLVQNFQIQYSKWNRQAFFYSNSVNQSALFLRKSAKQLTSQGEDEQESVNRNKEYFSNNKEKVLYYIQKFIFSQCLYNKYHQQYCKKKQEQEQKTEENESQSKKQQQRNRKQIDQLKYTNIYYDKYCKIEEKWKHGHSYQIGFRHMVECYSQQKKSKTAKKLIIIEDHNNFIIVQPSKQENKAKIIVNHPWKYVVAEIDRQTGRKMAIKLLYCFRGDNQITLHFEDQVRNAGTLQWMNSLKFERYQSEQAFILSYLKECLSKL